MVNTGAHAFVIGGTADREKRLAKSESCLRPGGDEPGKNKKDSLEPPKAVPINPPGSKGNWREDSRPRLQEDCNFVKVR
jgi:hypothetical protein